MVALKSTSCRCSIPTPLHQPAFHYLSEGLTGSADLQNDVEQLQPLVRRVEVEQRDDKVFITVGSGGAFPSGTADLTDEAQRILDRISLAAMSPESKITVTGHTDDVPISNAQFRDNWDLAAGRAASVVQAIQRTGLIDGDRLSAVSKGEMAPVADNTTAAGREQNRRIEIEITY